ncbi:sensor histidine kinase [Marinifilum flexuosum]|uniref:sensor histidine kinase n=1 Tax=Marinifilum flexuosum TaxID=1117708 RepID=UPI002491A116|nr:HAMP domain-containing sensor histidine kinase [Marinifilum flexuosum]
MKNQKTTILGLFIVCLLMVLVTSQIIWLSQQISREQIAFKQELENSVKSIVNFHALKGYGTIGRNPNTASLAIKETSDLEISQDTTKELGKVNIATDHYIPNFSLYKAIEGIFTDQSLNNGKININKIDSLFQNHFKGFDKIRSYEMLLYKNDTVLYRQIHNNETSNGRNFETIQFYLGTKETFKFKISYNINSNSFMGEMLLSISVSAVAVLLVGLFMMWLLWDIQKMVIKIDTHKRNITGIVHDLKSPLNYVYTLLDYLKNKNPEPIFQDQLSKASINISKLIKKIEQILIITRSNLEGSKIEKSPFPLSLKFEEIVSELSVIYENKLIGLNNTIPENIILNVNELYFEMALRNLLDNAFKYSENGSKILIHAEKKKDQTKILITDFGIGIAIKEQKKIFREFYRIKNNYHGYGIGLSFCNHIIRAHNGFIKLESEEGEGSTFKIVLPQ